MKYVIEKSTGEMVYALEDGAQAIITGEGLITETFRAADIKPDTHEIAVALPPCPSNWGREYRWNGSAWVAGSARRGRIVERLAAIDAASIRPARAVAAGVETADDVARLIDLETEADALRTELKTL